MTKQKLESSLDWRYATKRYDASKKISASDWSTLKNALLKAPSSFGLQPWKFILVETPAIREKLKAASWGQGQITDASHLVVFTAKEDISDADIAVFMKRIADKRGVTLDSLKGYSDAISGFVKGRMSEKGAAHAWAARQTYIALGFLLEAAALIDIDATPMEGLDPAEYDKILGLEKSGFHTVAVAALGYRHAEDAYQSLAKVRTPETEIFETR